MHILKDVSILVYILSLKPLHFTNFIIMNRNLILTSIKKKIIFKINYSFYLNKEINLE